MSLDPSDQRRRLRDRLVNPGGLRLFRGLRCCCAHALACASLALPLSDGLGAGMHSGLGKEPGSRMLALCQAVTAPGGSDRASALQGDARACLAFIDGFAWGHAWASWRESRDMWFCLPEGFSSEQGARDVVSYLQLHPDRLEEESHLLVFLALTAAYPCTP